ncbi:MAG: hypothetical protein JRM86_06170 [Nitrososphaerota archaeon]|nr:hypothetical protein [Nitrososphaerota archaeon]
MKRGRKPPKTWRRNMLAGVVLLAILDGTILSASHDLARAVIALAITVLVGAFVAWTWVSNSRLEREEARAPSQEGRRG